MIKLTERAQNTLEKRILLKDQEGNVIEDFQGMCHRVAKFLASSESEERDFFDILSKGEFLPNSPCLVNAGVPGRLNQLAACFVLDVPDSIDGIYKILSDSAKIFKSGGGVGYNFSNIRHKDSIVTSTGGIASGPVPFMRLYDESTNAIKQGGTRRGASMGLLSVEHPDIYEFISAKREDGVFNNFNISVGITDKFMLAVEKQKPFALKDPKTGETVREIDAQELFDFLVESAHRHGDPGVIFMDTIEKKNLLKGKGNKLVGVNPCAEQTLSNYEACCLGSINLSKMVDSKGNIKWERLAEVTRIATRFLNRIIDKGEFPLERIAKRVRESRKIGLGVMGWADALLQLKTPYDSQEAREFAESFASAILNNSVLESHTMGLEEGAFPLIEKFRPQQHIKDALETLGIPLEDYTPRNAALLTCAPTGTISIIPNCSSGIEPVFAWEQKEFRMDTTVIHKHPIYEKWEEANPDKMLPLYFQNAESISVEGHIKMQAAWQKYICAAVSKTINMPSSATVEDVKSAYLLAYKSGCKGITIYRDGSKANQVLSDAKAKGTAQITREFIKTKDRPDVLFGHTYSVNTGYGKMLVSINDHEGYPFEVVCTIGKGGASENAKAESIGRLISAMLQGGFSVEEPIKQLEGIVGAKPVFSELGLVKSIPDGIAKILRKHTKLENVKFKEVGFKELCPDCGNELTPDSGSCLVCTNCGYKSCGG